MPARKGYRNMKYIYDRLKLRRQMNAGTFKVEWIHNIVMNELKVFMTDPVLNVTFATRKKVIRNCDFVSLYHELVNEVRTNKARSASHLCSNSVAIVIIHKKVHALGVAMRTMPNSYLLQL